MPPAPPTLDEPRRLEELRRCAVLDTPPEQDFDALTALASRLCRTPIALVSLVDENRQWFKSRVGVDVCQTPRDQAFCAYAIHGESPLVIPDATLDPRVADNPLVIGAPYIRAYAGVPLRMPGGHPLGTLCVIDTSPRAFTRQELDDLSALARQVESQLRLRQINSVLSEAEHRATLASQAKSAFLATMSHEIRTPLTAVLGFLDVLLESDTPECARRDHALTIKRNADHLLSLINNVLDYSKIESGGMRVEHSDCSPAMKIWDVMHLLAPLAADKRIALDASLLTPIPICIQSDRVRIRQILVNLVSNAIKFTTSGFVHVNAGVLRSPERSQLRFSVTDSGIGMTPEQLTRIFQPFRQGDESTTRQFGGTGLGLTISKRLATLLGGDLSVESTPGSGSTFTLSIPIDPAWCEHTIDDWRDAPLHTLAPHHTDTPLIGRVLVAEDGIDNQRLIKHFLTRAGLDVEIAGDGQDAIARALHASPPFDLVLMDMHMPRMDGFEATRRLRAANITIPIIALTASVTIEARETCFSAGCTDFLCKPIDRRRLIDTCRLYIARAGDTSRAAAA